MRLLRALCGEYAVAAVLLQLATAGCEAAGGEEPGTRKPALVFRLANELTPESRIGDVSYLFKERLEQGSPDGRIAAGEIRVVLYDQGVVGTERQLLENAYFGVMEVVQVNSAVVSTIDPAYNLFDLPYLFVSDEHHQAVLNGAVGAAFLQRLSSYNLVGLGFYGLGFRNIFYKARGGRCVETPDDLRGLKLRVIESPIMISAINAMGASATHVPFSELFQALRTGVVDGADNSARVFTAHRFHEAGANCFTLTEHFTNQHVLVANHDWFRSLDGRYQRRIAEVAREIVPDFARRWDAATRESVQEMEASGVTVNEVADKQAFIERVEQVSESFLRAYPTVPRELYERIRSAADRSL